MAFAAGTFSLYTPGNPVVTGTTIASTWANNTLNDIATGLSTCLLKDGSQTVTANIPMSSFKFTGLAVGSAAADSARFDQIQAGVQTATSTYLTGTAGTNTITATATPTPTLAVGQRYRFIASGTNTGATTLNISSLGAGAVQADGIALAGGEIQSGSVVEVFVSALTPVFQLIINGQTRPFLDTLPLVKGSADGTKLLRFEVDGNTTGTTRVLTPPDRDMTLRDAAVLGTEVASTSGTTITFTGIPTWATKITFHFVGVSTNGTNTYLVQLGDSGGLEASGYNCTTSTGATDTAFTTGVGINSGSAANVWYGALVFTLERASTFTWSYIGNVSTGVGPLGQFISGTKATSAQTDRIGITTTGGADAFDLGLINIMYE